MLRPLPALLALLAALLLSPPGVFGEEWEAQPAPSESECRPYIEKALKELGPSDSPEESGALGTEGGQVTSDWSELKPQDAESAENVPASLEAESIEEQIVEGQITEEIQTQPEGESIEQSTTEEIISEEVPPAEESEKPLAIETNEGTESHVEQASEGISEPIVTEEVVSTDTEAPEASIESPDTQAISQEQAEEIVTQTQEEIVVIAEEPTQEGSHEEGATSEQVSQEQVEVVPAEAEQSDEQKVASPEESMEAEAPVEPQPEPAEGSGDAAPTLSEEAGESQPTESVESAAVSEESSGMTPSPTEQAEIEVPESQAVTEEAKSSEEIQPTTSEGQIEPSLTEHIESAENIGGEEVSMEETKDSEMKIESEEQAKTSDVIETQETVTAESIEVTKEETSEPEVAQTEMPAAESSEAVTGEVSKENIPEVADVSGESIPETPKEGQSETIPEAPLDVPTETVPEAPLDVPTETVPETSEIPSEIVPEQPQDVPSETVLETPSEVPIESIPETTSKETEAGTLETVGQESVSTDESTAETGPSGEDVETKSPAEEVRPVEELMMPLEIPQKLRPREHISEILRLDQKSAEIELLLRKTIDTTLRELKKLYESAIKPLEILYKYRDLSNRHFGDPEIFSKPLILFMGPWSGGKSTIINYLTDNEFKASALRTGAEPSPAYFNIVMWGETEEVLDGTQLAADWTFSGLQKFGQGLLDRLRGQKLNHPLLEKVNIVEIPGILEIRKQVERLFPFNDACQWFIDRADIIFLVYDPAKLDVGPESEAILDQLKGREYQTRIILNKADQVRPEELMRVQGTLIWNISPLMSSTEPPVMYSTSLWSIPYESGAPTRLLYAQEKAFLKDLRDAVDKRVENKIASARRFAVRVRNHAKMVDCYLTTYYNHKSFFGNKKKVSDDIIEHPQNYHIYEGLSTLTNISRYDLPDPDVYRDFFRLNPVYDFQQLSATCTYFRGCPINRLDVAIAYDLPELVGKYKKSAEEVLKSVNKSGNS